MSKAEKETSIRQQFINDYTQFMNDKYNADVRPVSGSEVMIPWMDEEGNEIYVVAKFSLPRGTRNGNGGYNAYDGYAEAEAYKADLEEKRLKKEKAEQKKADAIAEKERKRALRAKKAE